VDYESEGKMKKIFRAVTGILIFEVLLWAGVFLADAIPTHRGAGMWFAYLVSIMTAFAGAMFGYYPPWED
jgi:hypothetical protein